MTSLKERFRKWKEERSRGQKAGDIVFWLLLILLLIPGPRKVISTTVNRVFLLIKTPGMIAEDKQLTLGETEYEWTLQDHEGNFVKLGDYRDQPVFLNFWATWCPPCVAELPEIQKSYEKHWESVTYLLVTNQQPDVVEAFMEKYGYDLPVHYSTSALPPAFQHSSIPTTFILSPEGKIVLNKRGAMNWDSKGSDRIFKQLVR